MPQPCPICGTVNPDASKFCGECGGRLAASSGRSRPPSDQRLQTLGERRVVTALFADIKDYTSLSEKLDAEQVQELVGGLFEEFAQAVARHGGYVDKYMGDAVLALFGAPKSYGDDAERACACALEMQRLAAGYRQGEKARLQIRVGIASGEVVVGNIGQRGEYTAVGDAVNTANRIQGACEPGSVLVCDQTAQAVRARYRLTPLAPVTLKGKAEPQALYKVEGTLKLTEMFSGRFVGRARELELLRSTFDRAAASRHAAFVLVRGEAGMGKSRLAGEFTARLRRDGRAIARWQARFAPLGLEPLHGLRQLVRSALDVSTDTPRDEVARRAALHAGEGAATHLLYVLGLAAASADKKDADLGKHAVALRIVLKRLLESEATRRPLLLVFEDLHWADSETLAFVHYLARARMCAPLMVLALGRPEAIGGVRELLADPFEVIDLKALDEAELAELSRDVLRQGTLGAELASLVAQRTGGNPFVAAELLKGLRERACLVVSDGAFALAPGQSADVIPAGVRSILLSRMDALPAPERNVLSGVSALGRDFLDDAAVHLCGPEAPELLRKLVERGMMHDLGRERGRDRFQFCHALLQEVAYSGLLKRDRAAMHALAAAHYAALAPAGSRDARLLGLLGHHYAHSSQPALACEAFYRAGKVALESWNTVLARECLSHARDQHKCCASPPAFDGMTAEDSRLAMELDLIEATTDSGAYDQAQRLAEEFVAGNARHAVECARALEFAISASDQRNRHDDFASLSARALEFYRSAGDTAGERRVKILTARHWVTHGRAADALQLVEEAETSAADLTTVDRYRLESIRSAALRFGGRVADAIVAGRRALEFADLDGKPHLRAAANANLGGMLMLADDDVTAERHLLAAKELYERSGNEYRLSMLLGNYSSLLRRTGRTEEGVALINRALKMSRDAQDPGSIAMVLITLSHLHTQRGQFRDAAAHTHAALEGVSEARMDQYTSMLLVNAATIAANRGDNATAKRFLDQAEQAIMERPNLRVGLLVEHLRNLQLLPSGDFDAVKAKTEDLERRAAGVDATFNVRVGSEFKVLLGALCEDAAILRSAAEKLRPYPHERSRYAAIGLLATALEGAAPKALYEIAASYGTVSRNPPSAAEDEGDALAAYAVAIALRKAQEPELARRGLAWAERALAAMTAGGRNDLTTSVALLAQLELTLRLSGAQAAAPLHQDLLKFADKYEVHWLAERANRVMEGFDPALPRGIA